MSRLSIDKDTVDVRKKIAHRVRQLRKSKKWTQMELADQCGIGMRHIQRIESSETPRPVKLDTLVKISKAFKISLSSFFRF
ncbi:MAG: helix-turn-helix domain-containing protein [Thermodesulfobacteriota bacterium]